MAGGLYSNSLLKAGLFSKTEKVDLGLLQSTLEYLQT